MGEVADRLERALDRGEKIAVFGDFDVDGMTSTCLLTLGLRRLGGSVFPFIPHRFGEGYGLSREALARVREACDPDLVVTVDNGIAAAREVEWLVAEGVDVVVTDHHEPADLVPEGVPVTDPKLSDTCPSRDLAGAGVALKLVCELGRRRGEPDLWLEFRDVAALGTLSDMMRLSGENRALVSEGIELMRRGARPGLSALAATAGLDIAEATADSMPFSIIPRLNAAGRMGSTDAALDLLLTDDPAEAVTLAGRLEAVNSERRETEAALAEAALAEVERTYRGGRAVVVGGRGWHEGVKGIVASRLVSRYHVPSIVFTINEEGIARGSGRSVGSVDLFHAVEQCSDVLVRFGGHAGAVGITCEAARLDEFRERLERALDELPAEQFEDTGEVTAVVSLSELTVESIDALESLQPFGQGNKKPLFAVTGVSMRSRARVGADGSHLRFLATDGANSVAAIMFRAPDPERAASWEGVVDLVFEAVNETWQGRIKPKLMVKDILFRDVAGLGDPSLADELLAQAEDEMMPRPGAARPDARPSCPEGASELRAELSRLSKEELTDALRRALIGDAALLPAQAAALDRLSAGRSCLAVMATGRGKSLVFHLHAAREALRSGRASVFVYPLRALVADQAFHLSQDLAPLGVSVEVLTGETPGPERERVLLGLADGTVDVVLTTPEFLSIHRARFAESRRVGFLVVDEAHHAGASKPGDRDAYLELPAIRHDLGEPVCLAVTATAAREVAARVCDLLAISPDDVVVDEAVRGNLVIDDLRELRDRDSALASIVALGERAWSTSRRATRPSRSCACCATGVPELAARVAFYHAGLGRDVRARVERAFRGDDLSCIVSTSAFGEGVNLPGSATWCSLGSPLGQVEFNQMSGRAGPRRGAGHGARALWVARRLPRPDAPQRRRAPARAARDALTARSLSLSRSLGEFPLDDALIAREALSLDPRAPISRRRGGDRRHGLLRARLLRRLRLGGGPRGEDGRRPPPTWSSPARSAMRRACGRAPPSRSSAPGPLVRPPTSFSRASTVPSPRTSVLFSGKGRRVPMPSNDRPPASAPRPGELRARRPRPGGLQAAAQAGPRRCPTSGLLQSACEAYLDTEGARRSSARTALPRTITATSAAAPASPTSTIPSRSPLILAHDLRMDEDPICAALLHDTVEDTPRNARRAQGALR